MSYYTFIKSYGILLLTFVSAISLSAQSTASAVSASDALSWFENLDQANIEQITLRTNLHKFLANKNKSEYQKAKMTYTNEKGEVIQHKLKIKSRGRSRLRLCDFPPVKLNFDKDELKTMGLSGESDKYKLVTHCLEEDGTENLLREYLTYQLYNQLTDQSYRVKLLTVTYEDSKDSLPAVTQYGFIIESNDEMVSRVGREMVEEYNLGDERIDDVSNYHTSLFQYMIGNTDWDMSAQRNVKFIRPQDGSDQLLVVPYDFDFSGLVNAGYAIPNPDIDSLTTVRDRALMFARGDRQAFAQVMEAFKSKRAVLFETVDSFDLLKKKSKKDIRKYLESFFEILDDPKRSATEFAALSK